MRRCLSARHHSQHFSCARGRPPTPCRPRSPRQSARPHQLRTAHLPFIDASWFTARGRAHTGHPELDALSARGRFATTARPGRVCIPQRPLPYISLNPGWPPYGPRPPLRLGWTLALALFTLRCWFAARSGPTGSTRAAAGKTPSSAHWLPETAPGHNTICKLAGFTRHS